MLRLCTSYKMCAGRGSGGMTTDSHRNAGAHSIAIALIIIIVVNEPHTTCYRTELYRSGKEKDIAGS